MRSGWCADWTSSSTLSASVSNSVARLAWRPDRAPCMPLRCATTRPCVGAGQREGLQFGPVRLARVSMRPCASALMRTTPRVPATHSAPSYHSKSNTVPPSPCAAPMKDHGDGSDMRIRSPSVAAHRPPSRSAAQRDDAEAAEVDALAQLVVGAEAEQFAAQRADHEAAVGQRQHHVGVRCRATRRRRLPGSGPDARARRRGTSRRRRPAGASRARLITPGRPGRRTVRRPARARTCRRRSGRSPRRRCARTAGCPARRSCAGSRPAASARTVLRS